MTLELFQHQTSWGLNGKSLAVLETQWNSSRHKLILQAISAAFAHCCKSGPRAEKRDYREDLCPCNCTQLSHSQPEQNAELTVHTSASHSIHTSLSSYSTSRFSVPRLRKSSCMTCSARCRCCRFLKQFWKLSHSSHAVTYSPS